MSSLSRDYASFQTGLVFIERSDRALLEVMGRDRAAWLHNLTTNQVKTLQQGEGNYAFCLNVQGRILFDLSILVRPESIWLDLDSGFIDTARKHFDKYSITEDVKLADHTQEFARFALAGEGAKALFRKLGVPHLASLPLMGSSEINLAGTVVLAARTDFCGPFAIEFFAQSAAAEAVRQTLVKDGQVLIVGPEAIDIHRIEAGIPWPGHEITQEYLPAETGQLRRAVSFQKGCYLGQEVVERMRSRGVVARLLRGLLIENGDASEVSNLRSFGVPDISNLKSDISDLKSVDSGVIPPPGASVVDASGKTVGMVTSSCHSPALNKSIAMAYLKSAGAAPGQQVSLTWEGGSTKAMVVELPFTRGQAD